jgi:hypothetical protein
MSERRDNTNLATKAPVQPHRRKVIVLNEDKDAEFKQGPRLAKPKRAQAEDERSAKIKRKQQAVADDQATQIIGGAIQAAAQAGSLSLNSPKTKQEAREQIGTAIAGGATGKVLSWVAKILKRGLTPGLSINPKHYYRQIDGAAVEDLVKSGVLRRLTTKPEPGRKYTIKELLEFSRNPNAKDIYFKRGGLWYGDNPRLHVVKIKENTVPMRPMSTKYRSGSADGSLASPVDAEVPASAVELYLNTGKRNFFGKGIYKKPKGGK